MTCHRETDKELTQSLFHLEAQLASIRKVRDGVRTPEKVHCLCAQRTAFTPRQLTVCRYVEDMSDVFPAPTVPGACTLKCED